MVRTTEGCSERWRMKPAWIGKSRRRTAHSFQVPSFTPPQVQDSLQSVPGEQSKDPGWIPRFARRWNTWPLSDGSRQATLENILLSYLSCPLWVRLAGHQNSCGIYQRTENAEQNEENRHSGHKVEYTFPANFTFYDESPLETKRAVGRVSDCHLLPFEDNDEHKVSSSHWK